MLFSYRKFTIFSVFIIIIFIAGCKSNGGKITEGEIIYGIEYLQDEREMPILALLPKEMSIKFKQNNTVSVIEGFWGTFVMRFITDYNNGKTYTTLRLGTKKYIFEADTGSVAPGYEEMQNIKIEETGKDTIFYINENKPLKCYEADVYMPVFGDKPLKFYYTYDIAIKDPNINNPFHQIHGVLVSFQVRLVGIDMKFKIKEINLIPVDDSEFAPPADYEQISKDEFSKFLKSFTE